MTSEVSIDLQSQYVKADPYPMYAQLREYAPVRPVILPSGTSVYLVTRYAEARQLLADPRLSKDPTRMADSIPGPSRQGFDLQLAQHMLNADPPEHTRLRRLVSKVFTARRVEALRPRVQELTDDLLDRMAEHGEADLIDALAFPLPIAVICELLGVPMEDRESFRDWSNTLVAGQAAADRLPMAMAQLSAYLRELIAAKRASLGADLLSELIAVRDAGDRLSEAELTSMVFLLLIAGHETTVNLIGNGMYLLLTHPDQGALLRAEPERVPAAVEEFLRYECPVEISTFRYTTEPVDAAGTTIPAGTIVLISLASANRDTARFDDADRLDVTRTDVPHLAFGHGIHFCLGAPLARLEADVAFRGLLRRLPGLTLAVAPERLAWRPGMLMRGLVDLPVRW